MPDGTVRPSRGTIERAGTGRPGLVVRRDAVSDALPITVRETVAMGRWALRGPWRRLTGRIVAEGPPRDVLTPGGTDRA